MIRWHLMMYLWQKVKVVMWVAILGWLALVLFSRGLLTVRDVLPAVMVMVQAAALAMVLGRYKRGEFGFLYTRGFGRDVLMWHTMLVAVVAGMLPIFVAAFVVWSGLRSSLQDGWWNPLFPIAAVRENAVPWVWMALCVVAVPVGQYVWVRRASAIAGRWVGDWLAGAVVVGLFSVAVISFYCLDGWRLGLLVVAGVGIVLAVVIGARAAHRELEVRA
ncbi:MAG: hypothetical protein FWD53_06695 [Phycisphaerales bacterium]|nr:hypothetical protein [Phycisphaerales bacterium]